MDAEAENLINKWVCEFILRWQQNPRFCPKNLLLTMKLKEDNNDCAYLRKSAVLRDIWDCLTDGAVDEKILDLLELMEKLLLQEGCIILESLKSAYCWVATECTVRYMAVNATEGFYLDALERIWAERVRNLKERNSNLVTLELVKWEDDLLHAIEDPDVYQRIRETNTRYVAFSHLYEFVREYWAMMGCSALELEVKRRFQGKSKDTSGKNGLNPDGILNEPGDVDHGLVSLDDDTIDIGNEPIIDKMNKTVAEELKECLLEMMEFIDGTSQPVQANQDQNEGPAKNLNDRASDSGGTSSNGVRPHLSTPKQANLSPSKRGRLSQPRDAGRSRHYWTFEEVQALREGVKKYGKAWKDIKDANPGVFAGRTEVDLKDKWRNLVG